MFVALGGKLSVFPIFSFAVDRGLQASADFSMCPRHHMRRRQEKLFFVAF